MRKVTEQIMKRLKFFTKNNYGQTAIYPTAEIAKQVQQLTGKKTVNELNLQALSELGFEITIDNGNYSKTIY